MNIDALPRSEKIALLNDEARRSLGGACVLCLSGGFKSLRPLDKFILLDLVENYDAFNPQNDPRGEHDSGAIYQLLDGAWVMTKPKKPRRTVYWFIDYFDPLSRWYSEDPANPALSRRAVTIMLAEELPEK